MNQDASSGPQDRRLRAVITEYKRRLESGQTVDQQAFLKAYPELADGLKQFFQGEASSLNPALASTKLGRFPGQDMSVRETAHPGRVEAETASEFSAKMFGRYQLLRPLGEGAMGSVFLAQDTHLDRRVALKMPRSSAADKMKDRGEFLARFTREAKAAAGLKHPNICSVYDAGEIDETAYITMDFIDGVTLSQLIGTDRLKSLSDVLRIVRVIADAVLHAHQKGIVHRDLKPGNILVDDQMNPFVTDFGLARRDSSNEGSRITQEGLLIGTPAYMAPEQVRGEQTKVGAVSDIYGLGVIFFELLTGRLPFEGSMPEMLAKVLRDPPPIPSRLRPDLTEDVDDVVWKMLSKEPDRRYQSMQDVITAIDKLADKLQRATSRETTTSEKATVAAAQSPFEIQKSHIELMLRKGQYAGAIRDLEALAEEKSPAAKAVVEWARKTLPSAKKEAKALSPSGLAAMLKTAEQMFEKCDYQGCIQLLDDVPSLKRSEAMETLLQKAQQREAAAEELMEQIRDKERRENPEGLESLVKKYLKLKPGNAYAKKLMQALQTYSKTPAGRRKYRFERGRLQPMPAISFFRQYALLAVLVGVLSFLASYAYVIIYLKGGSQTIAVHVDDEWLREQGGELTLLVDGDEHTISTSPSNGEPLTIVVKVGDREFSVKHGDTVVHNPRTFTIERDGRSILQITPTDMELRNSPLMASGTLGSGSSDLTKASNGSTNRTSSSARMRPLTELNTGALDISPWVSGDGLRIYWERRDAPASDGIIMQAERKAVGSPFENARQVIKGSQPTLSDDELDLVFIHTGTRGPKTLMRATRANRTAAFSSATEIDPGEAYMTANSPYLSADGLTLTVNLKSSAANLSTRHMQLRRISRSGQFGGAEEVNVEWNMAEEGAPLTWIAMASDGLSFLATHEQDKGGFRVLRFRRGATDQPFKDYEYLSLPGIPEVYGRTPRYIPATREFFLTAPAVYPTSRDTNSWKNNYEGRLWVIENADFNASAHTHSAPPLVEAMTDLDKVATGTWKTIDCAIYAEQLPENATLIPNGISLREKIVPIPEISGRDVILRADVRKVSGRNAGLQVRLTTAADGWKSYIGWYAGEDHNGGDFFGVGKSADGIPYQELGTAHSGMPPSADGFVDMAIAAIGETITLFVEGKQVLQFQDNSHSSGQFAVSSTRTFSEFRNIRYQLLDAESPASAHETLPGEKATILAAPFDAATAAAQTKLWSSKINEPEELEEAGIKLKLIPPGEFTMGSPDSEPDRDPSVEPQHAVRITQPFFMGVTEITQKQWVDVMGTSPWKDQPHVKEGDNYAACYVDWIGVKEFCRRLSAKTGQTFRLPTEAEWEYACRAGTTTTWYFGNDVEGLDAHGWFDFNTLHVGNRFPHEVAKKQPNPFGLYDMHGNLFEWCEDFFVPRAYSRRVGITEDPLVMAHAEPLEMHVTRGGGFDWNGYHIRSALRGAAGPEFLSERDGFRVVRLCKSSPEVVRAEEPANAPFPALKARAYQQAWADHLQLPVHFTNSIGMKFRLIPPGSFTIGSTQEQIDAARRNMHIDPQDPERLKRLDSELPRQRITLTRPFYLGVTEVTIGQFETVVGPHPVRQKGVELDPNIPVSLISWVNTGEFCGRLTIREGRPSAYTVTPDLISQTGTGGYRLPTEAEWEFACRAGTETLYSTGDSEESLVPAAWMGFNNEGSTKPVAQRLPNPFGLFDMHGNAAEWVHDGWRPDAYQLMTGPAATDPRSDLALDGLRVIRGGSHFMHAAEGRSASRSAAHHDSFWGETGFRVALSIEAVRQMLANRTP